MNTQLNTKALAFAGAIASAVLTLVCFTIYALAGRPDPWMALFIGSGPTALGWVIGIVELGLVGALLGGVVGAVYNRFTKTAA